MKIAFLGNEVKREEDIATFSQHWSFHLPREMVKLGCQYDIISLPAGFDSLSENEKGKFLDDLDVSNYEHIIGLGLRLFSKMPIENTKNLRSRVKGCLGHIYDGGLLDSYPVDLTFTFRNDDHLYPPGTENNRFNRHLLNNKYIGWAASEKYPQPKQKFTFNFSRSCLI